MNEMSREFELYTRYTIIMIRENRLLEQFGNNILFSFQDTLSRRTFF